MLTQEQLLIILRQFHLVAHEWGGTPERIEVETVRVLYDQLNEKSKQDFKEDCSELVEWIEVP